MIFLLVVINVAISWFNAWVCGRNWAEGKVRGGLVHLTNWAGAIMSACGFTWSMLIMLAMMGSAIPVDSTNPQQVVYAIPPQLLRVIVELGYVAIIVPLLGSGLVITVSMWVNFIRRPTLLGGAISAYDTVAQIHNTYQAVQLLPGVLSHLKNVFGKAASDDSEDGLTPSWLMIGVALVVIALGGGILLTRAILLASARAAANDFRRERAMADVA